MIKRLLSALFAMAIGVSPAFADYAVTVGSGTTIKAGSLSGGVLPWANLVDGTGTAIGTVANPWITGYSVGGTATVAPGTSYGLNIDCNSSSNLCTILTQGYGVWGSAYSSTGNAIAIGGYDGSTLRPVTTNSSGQLILGAQTAAGGGDPCTSATKTNAGFSSASGTFSIVTGVSGKKIYVCSIVGVSPTAVSYSLAEGSSSSCGTSNQAAVMGVATSGTAANGMAFAANGGLALGNGTGTVASTATSGDYLCIFQSGTAQIAGNVTYVQQ